MCSVLSNFAVNNSNLSSFCPNKFVLTTFSKNVWSIIERTLGEEIVLGISHGTGKVTGPSTGIGEGEFSFVTQSPKLSWLNNRKWRVEVTTNNLTREDHVKFFAL